MISYEIQTPYLIMTPQIKGYDQNIHPPLLIIPPTNTVGECVSLSANLEKLVSSL